MILTYIFFYWKKKEHLYFSNPHYTKIYYVRCIGFFSTQFNLNSFESQPPLTLEKIYCKRKAKEDWPGEYSTTEIDRSADILSFFSAILLDRLHIEPRFRCSNPESLHSTYRTWIFHLFSRQNLGPDGIGKHVSHQYNPSAWCLYVSRVPICFSPVSSHRFVSDWLLSVTLVKTRRFLKWPAWFEQPVVLRDARAGCSEFSSGWLWGSTGFRICWAINNSKNRKCLFREF